MKSGCAGAMERAGLVDTLTELFTLTHTAMSTCPTLNLATASSNTTTTTATTTTPTTTATNTSTGPTTAATAAPPSPGPTKDKEKDKDKDKDPTATDGPGTPKWLSPGLLLIDLYEKLAVATKRRASVSKVQ